MVGRDRRVIVCSNGLDDAFGKLVGGCFGARVDGFEREKRICLDSWEMLCTGGVSSVTALVMLRKGGHRRCRAKMPAPMMATPIDILLQRGEEYWRTLDMGKAGRPWLKSHCRPGTEKGDVAASRAIHDEHEMASSTCCYRGFGSPITYHVVVRGTAKQE